MADDLVARIDAGEYAPGSSLPPYRQLATDYDVAVNTALAAVRLLRDLGAVTIRPNAGATVRDRAADTDLATELTAARAVTAELRERVSVLSEELTALEARLDALVGRVSDEPTT